MLFCLKLDRKKEEKKRRKRRVNKRRKKSENHAEFNAFVSFSHSKRAQFWGIQPQDLR